ncbi:hypothetical protein [Pedobacter jamesrossensis]|uniref:Uncharacterized protein n=1 Tax=Pedobacter jamesrossensis TaxID=1908238 RepID=A0ABV8NQL3_9SPHI
MKSLEKIQSLLPIGYLFLVLMGILKESILYYQLGINILKYSTIMDILISPIADLTANPTVLLPTVILFFLLPFLITRFLSAKSNKKWVQKISGLKKGTEELTVEQVKNHFSKLLVLFITIGLLSFFLGIGIGKGQSISKRIKTNNLKFNDKLNFNTGESENVYIIGLNSAYYFYITKGSQIIKIAPVGTIKNIELTDNRMLK